MTRKAVTTAVARVASVAESGTVTATIVSAYGAVVAREFTRPERDPSKPVTD
jgi:hypothetical protein